MDQSILEHELRQIKRRRIEIRSAQAALDLEDLNLDDRQNDIERLLRSGTSLASSNSMVNPSTSRNDHRQVLSHSKPVFTAPVQSNNRLRDVQPRNNTIKAEAGEQSPQQSVVTIDDFNDKEADDEDMIMLDHDYNARPNHTIKASSTNSPVLSLSSNISSPEARIRLSSPSPPLSKMVVLKVRYPGSVHHQRKNSHIHPRKKPMPIVPQPRQRWPRPAETSKQPTKPKRQPSSHQNSRSSQMSPNANKSLERQIPSIDLTCQCEGRNRNCGICRGTPAVIAEGRLLSSQMPPSLESTSTRRLSQRPITRPTSYQIPDFEEMTDTERLELETQFIRRIVTHLAKVLKPDSQDDEGSEELNLRHSLWVERLRARADISKHLSDSLQSLLKRRAVARENSEGIWDGRIMVPPCKDIDEFTKKAHEIGSRLTSGHPAMCCATQGDVDVDLDMEPHGEDTCWREGFQLWLSKQKHQCTKCINACASAVDFEERTGIVDDWGIS